MSGPTNVPSGTCIEGIFSTLNLSDDHKMNGLQSKLQSSIELGQQQPNSNNHMLFNVSTDRIGSNAFALVAHG